eukprot:tig00021036_g17374.t1
MAKDPKKPKKPKAAKPQPAQPQGAAPAPAPAAGQATGTGAGTAPAAGASCAMGMTEDGQQLTPEQVNAFLDNSKTGGIERMACLPELKWFDVNTVKSDATVVCVGKRRTDKSFFLRDLMFNLSGTFPGGIVISQTDRLNGYWKQYIPQRFIWPKYNPGVLFHLFRRQQAIMQHNKSEDVLAGKEDPVDPRFFVLLDDVISDARLRYDEALNELFVAGRHYKIMTLITTQYAKGINPVLRSNTDLAVIFKCSQAMQREALAKEWGDIISQRAFYYLLDKYTQDNHCLIIDSSNNSTNPLDVLYVYKAEEPPPFRIGSKEYWEGETVNGENLVGPDDGTVDKTLLGMIDNFRKHRGLA